MSSSPRSRSFLVGLAVFLVVVSLGELYALFLQYQNNSNLRTYLSENSLQVYTRIGGLLILGLGAAYLTHLLSRTKQTSWAGRLARKLWGLSPAIFAVLALVVWFTTLAGIVGGSFTNFEVYVVAVVLVISAGMMARDRLTLRMAVRNFTRRKTNMAIVIAGLMIGTAMISGSLVTGDTLTTLFTGAAYFGYGHADEVVYARNATTFGYRFFSLNLYHNFAGQLTSDPSAHTDISGVTPEILNSVSVNNTNRALIQTGVALIGTFGNASAALGDFHSQAGGGVIPSTFSDGEAVINDRTARDLNATAGDTILVYSFRTLPFRVVGIAVSDERADFSLGDNIFVTLNAAQQLTGQPGSFNYLAITNIGGLRDSIQYSQTVGLAANKTLNSLLAPPTGFGCKTDPSQTAGPAASLCAYAEKQASVNSTTQAAQSLSNLFLVLSAFAIIAGVVLIANIFVMLAEERKSEMGMARAVGMKRGQLTKLFLFEGSLYSAGSAFVGVFLGIAIGYVILYVFAEIITRFFTVNLAAVLNSFTYTPASLLTAFTEGFLITFFTILLTSWRVSRLNVIRAIRNIPEPPRGVRTYTWLMVLGVVFIIAGVLLFQTAAGAQSAIDTLAGPSLVIFGIGLVLSRFLKNRYAFSLTGVALLVQWGVPNFSYDNPLIKSYTYGPELYFVGGIIMVLGAILVVMYNTDVAINILHLFYRGRKTLTPIFKTALSYPENKRFRTAATVAMFALVMFTVSAIAVIAAEQNAALNTVVKQESGGYDIITQTLVPVSNLTARVNADQALAGKIAATVPFNGTLVAARDQTLGRDFGVTILLGADPYAQGEANFFRSNTFNMTDTLARFPSASAVWNDVMANSSDVVWSFGFVTNRGPPTAVATPNAGDVMVLIAQRPDGSLFPAKYVRVVGVMNGFFFNGIVGTSQLLHDAFNVGTGTLGFVKAASGVDQVNLANILKRDFVRLQMTTTVIQVVLNNFLQVGQSFLGLFEGFLGLGLVVGIAGLGIISIRSVVERRQEIGILRAIGFRKRMVLAAFLIESSYVALLGILIGVSLGINLGYAAAVSPGSSLHFVLPWQQLLEIIGLSYALAMLTTFSSARRAARVSPAEALRYSE